MSAVFKPQRELRLPAAPGRSKLRSELYSVTIELLTKPRRQRNGVLGFALAVQHQPQNLASSLREKVTFAKSLRKLICIHAPSHEYNFWAKGGNPGEGLNDCSCLKMLGISWTPGRVLMQVTIPLTRTLHPFPRCSVNMPVIKKCFRKQSSDKLIFFSKTKKKGSESSRETSVDELIFRNNAPVHSNRTRKYDPRPRLP